jgi:hypothetical protein
VKKKREKNDAVFYFAAERLFFYIDDVITSPEKEKRSTYHYSLSLSLSHTHTHSYIQCAHELRYAPGQLLSCTCPRAYTFTHSRSCTTHTHTHTHTRTHTHTCADTHLLQRQSYRCARRMALVSGLLLLLLPLLLQGCLPASTRCSLKETARLSWRVHRIV